MASGFILDNLIPSVHHLHRECPEECREAIASLMFAAARFSDLPELRDLRQIFQERFGTSLEHLKNQKVMPQLPTSGFLNLSYWRD